MGRAFLAKPAIFQPPVFGAIRHDLKVHPRAIADFIGLFFRLAALTLRVCQGHGGISKREVGGMSPFMPPFLPVVNG